MEKSNKQRLRPLVSQCKNFKAIRWLVDTSRKATATGRTTALALAFIDNALSNPGHRVRLFDHYYDHDPRAIAVYVEDIIHNYGLRGFTVKRTAKDTILYYEDDNA